MNQRSELEKSPIELLLLCRILHKLEKVEIDQSFLLIMTELKTLQEKGTMRDIRDIQKIRFDEIDLELRLAREEIKKERVSLIDFRRMVEFVMDKYFVKEVPKKSRKWFWWK